MNARQKEIHEHPTKYTRPAVVIGWIAGIVLTFALIFTLLNVEPLNYLFDFITIVVCIPLPILMILDYRARYHA